jgi:hypothetical protein
MTQQLLENVVVPKVPGRIVAPFHHHSARNATQATAEAGVRKTDTPHQDPEAQELFKPGDARGNDR